MWRYYNPNPAGRSVGDCAVRAIAKALDISWDDAYDLITEAGKKMREHARNSSVLLTK